MIYIISFKKRDPNYSKFALANELTYYNYFTIYNEVDYIIMPQQLIKKGWTEEEYSIIEKVSNKFLSL